MYRLLLLLLPRKRRATYGAEMSDVFTAMSVDARHERGWIGIATLWLKEAVGMLKFSARDRLHQHSGGGRPSWRDELAWAWRGVRGRRWRALAIVLLLGVALGANAVVFSAADAFVFRTVPYAHPEQLVVIQKTSNFDGAIDYTWRDVVFEFRKHADLFAGIQAHERGASAYLTSGGITETVRAQQITPGLFELLGVLPRFGRPFVSADAEKGAPPVVVISDALARRLFGGAELAVGKSFFTGTNNPTVVGVMAPEFRFPSAVEQIWQPFNLETREYNFGVRNVARLHDGWTAERAAGTFTERLPAVAAVVPEDTRKILNRDLKDNGVSLRSLADFKRNTGATTIFAMLVGAGACLLLIACANVASLELSAAGSRTRTYAVQAALGASRASLIRISLIEGGILLLASAIVATTLASWGIEILSNELTVAMREALANPLDVDPRVIAFMSAIAAAAWLMTSLPSVLRLSKLSVVDGLRHDPRVMPVSSAAARTRQLLMTAQVAMTVMLLVGALLYIRTYETRVGLDKGLDANAVVSVQVSQAPDLKRPPAELEAEVLARLRGLPGVQAVARTWSLPPSTQSGSAGPLTINGQVAESKSKWTMVSHYSVDPEYFQVMSIRLVAGQFFDASTRPEQVVIDERFARAFWPNTSPLGDRFRIGSTGTGGVNEFEVIGVSREMRADRLATPTGDNVFVSYIRLSPRGAPLTFVAKLDDEDRLPMLAEAARSVAPRLMVRTDTIEARYRRLEADTRLAAAITGGFGAIAWIVATCGIFAVMAFLVAGRTREIGIRMALGADKASVRRMVLGSSLRAVLIGVAIGLAASAVASQWIAAQLYGVTATDPATYAGVALLIIATAVLATWLPARRAARVDPAVTLRSE
jgi:predicted permease